MNIGFLGLGKLGLPVALAVEARGHCVVGYDVTEQVRSILEARQIRYQEESAQEYLDKSRIQFVDVKEVVRSKLLQIQ